MKSKFKSLSQPFKSIRSMNMKRISSLFTLTAVLLALGFYFTASSTVFAQGKPEGKGFVDANNDGYNDNAMDDDGDGIPNGQDPDYVPVEGVTHNGHGFLDADGDGVNDYAQDADGDGIPNGQDPDWVAPADGSGQQAANGRGQRSGNSYKGSHGFVDADGDGFNDNAQDADLDGIPNGQDADYVSQNPGRGKGVMGFVDEDGDGINDNALDDDGDGIPNGKDEDFVRAQDGTGRNAGAGRGQRGSGTQLGTGECDGTGSAVSPMGTRGQKRGGRN